MAKSNNVFDLALPTLRMRRRLIKALQTIPVEEGLKHVALQATMTTPNVIPRLAERSIILRDQEDVLEPNVPHLAVDALHGSTVEHLNLGHARAVLPGICRAIEDAEIVLWRGDLWDAAVQDSDLAFQGDKPLAEQLVLPIPQLWAIEPGTKSEWLNKIAGERYRILGFLLISEAGTLTMQSVGNIDIKMPGTRLWIHFLLDDTMKPKSEMPRILSDILHDGSVAGTAVQCAFMGLLAFLRQRIAAAERVRGTRPEARAVERQAQLREGELPAIKSVVLRLPERQDGDSESTGRKYQRHSSWMVKGHWRRLHQPRKADGEQHTYVRPHAKGDPTKPMTTPQTSVFRVER